MALSFTFGGIFGKKRNRRTFNQVSKSEEEVALLTKEDFQQFSLAFSYPRRP